MNTNCSSAPDKESSEELEEIKNTKIEDNLLPAPDKDSCEEHEDMLLIYVAESMSENNETKKLSFLTVLLNNCVLFYFVKMLMLMDGKCPYNYWPICPSSGICYNGRSIDQQGALVQGGNRLRGSTIRQILHRTRMQNWQETAPQSKAP